MTEHLRVTVDAVPEPGFLRPAIEAAVNGRVWPPGPEAQIAAAVAAALPRQDPGSGRDPASGPDRSGGEVR
jgi:hypothetical protein